MLISTDLVDLVRPPGTPSMLLISLLILWIVVIPALVVGVSSYGARRREHLRAARVARRRASRSGARVVAAR
jgi:hypothetical protein